MMKYIIKYGRNPKPVHMFRISEGKIAKQKTIFLFKLLLRFNFLITTAKTGQHSANVFRI